MEEWRDIKGYEGLYQVSNKGRVRSLDRVVAAGRGGGDRNIKGRIIVLRNHGSGYKMVNLWRENEYKITYAHILVAQAFIPNPEGKPEVNHINGYKTDNRVENLEWCTSRENSLHARNTGLLDSMIKKYSKPIVMLDNGVIVREFSSAHEAERELGINNSSINSCCRRGSGNAGGYQWKFKEE